jgi:hypothetical protein
MLILMLAFALVSCEEDSPDDFWDQLASDDVVVEDNVQGRMYEKARFYCPVQRRLSLYPGAHKAVVRLQGCARMEFIYDAKVPSLVFLDSQDVTVEKLDICKMSEDEIIGILNLRGFSSIPEETESVPLAGEGGKPAAGETASESADEKPPGETAL